MNKKLEEKRHKNWQEIFNEYGDMKTKELEWLKAEKEEEIKEKIRKLPIQKREEAKRVLKEIKRLKEEGKDELDDEMMAKFLEFKALLK